MATTSMFDPESFMNQTVEGGFETRTTPAPEGEHLAVIDDWGAKAPVRVAKTSVVFDIPWKILDGELAKSMGLKGNFVVRQGVFLDIDDNGRLEKGPNKNVALGKVREAVGQNNVEHWSMQMLKNAGPAKIRIKHRLDDKDPTIVYADVQMVVKAQ